MATHFVVQAFKKQGRKIIPDQPGKARNAEDAIDKARRLKDHRVGVVAYLIEVDPEVDYWGEPEVLFRTGELPPDFDDI
ncbi:hypothetical protein [Tateyamaria sp.]|uniref:hypothetical protein n=1 Tax=Tateyamaria sp. TaxID=1929288 RepID=UPI00329CD3DA